MAFVTNRMSTLVEDYSILMLGPSGFGKSTLMYQICEKLFGHDGYGIFDTGDEDGLSALDGVRGVTVSTFKDWEKECLELIEAKKNGDEANLKVVVIDTLDELILKAELQAIINWNRKNQKNKDFRPATTLNQIEGGFKGPSKAVCELIYGVVRKLKEAGIQVWYTCHLKTKDIVDPITQETYQTLSADLSQTYFEFFKTKVSLVPVGYIDRSIETQNTGRKNIVTKKDITVNKVTEESRRITFRDDNYSCDSKSRLCAIDADIPLDADTFIKTIKNGIEESKKLTSSFSTLKETTKKVEPKKAKPKVEVKEEEPAEELDDDLFNMDEVTVEVEEAAEEIVYPKELGKAVTASFKKCEDADLKDSVKAIIKDAGGLPKCNDDTLKKLYRMLEGIEG